MSLTQVTSTMLSGVPIQVSTNGAITTINANNTPVITSNGTTTTISANNTQTVFIDANNFVGVGLSNPSAFTNRPGTALNVYSTVGNLGLIGNRNGAYNQATITGYANTALSGAVSPYIGEITFANSGSSANNNYGGEIDFYVKALNSNTVYTAANMLSTGIVSFPQGITFSGNPGGGTQGTLNDYEVGTWTPGLLSDSTAASNYTTQTGYYIKIGKQVTLWFNVRASTIPSGTYMRISGLPFSVGTSGTGYQSLNVTSGSGLIPIFLETYLGTSNQAFQTASGYANPSSYATLTIGGVYTYTAST